jgi:hypothetical protein
MFSSLLHKTHHAVGRVAQPTNHFRNKRLVHVLKADTPEAPSEV